MNWNGIAPFNAPCETAPWMLIEKHPTTVRYVMVNRTCKVCQRPFTRKVSSGNASRVKICEKHECRVEWQKQINRRNRARKAA